MRLFQNKTTTDCNGEEEGERRKGIIPIEIPSASFPECPTPRREKIGLGKLPWGGDKMSCLSMNVKSPNPL